MWYGQDVMRYKLLYEMIMFLLKLSATGRSLMVVSLLHKMQAPNNCFTLSLSGSDSRRSNSWRDDNDATMEIKVPSQRRWWSWRCFGDGDQRHKMTMAISYHIYHSSCLDHITSQHALQKQVRRPLLCCCKFYVATTGWARTVLTYASKPQWYFVKLVMF